VKNLPQELQLKDDAGLGVVVKAEGADIIAYMLGRRRSLVVDYSELEYRNGSLMVSTSRLVNNAASALPGSLSFRYFKDNMLVLETEQMTMDLPVMLGSSFVAAGGLEIGDVEFVPRTVAVTAPSAVFEKMSYIQFGADSLITIGNDTVISCSLVNSDFVKYDPVTITASIRTEPYVNVRLSRKAEINASCQDGAESKCLLFVPVTVRCKVPKSMMSELGDGHLKVSVASRHAAADGRDTLRFAVSALPFFVKEDGVTVEPELVVLD
jgi:hypothetical protein